LGKTAKERLGQLNWDKLGTDGFVIKSTSDGIFIAGNEDLGTLYGTYHFLEKHLGVRWFMPGEIGEVVPKRVVLRVGTFDETEIPSFRVRWIEEGPWALRQKMNVRVNVGEQPVGINWKWHFHSHFKLIPPEKYFAAHPEWFALVNGKRSYKHRYPQLCTSNPELIKEAAKNIIKIFDEEPNVDILAFGPQDSDGRGFCECDKCRALDEERPAEQQWHALFSNRLAIFNNEVAKRVAKKYPDKLIKVGAYAMHFRVPLDSDYRPESNLAIQACHTYSCNNHRVALPTCESNRKHFSKDLERWAKLTKHLFIYEYYRKGAWGGLPYWQIHVIREDLPYFHKLGVESFYTQPARSNWSAHGLNHYIAAKLTWNVKLDVDRLLEDFYEKFYGSAAKPMRKYYETLERAFVEADTCLSPFNFKWTAYALDDFFRPKVVSALEEAVIEAEQMAQTDIVRERIQLVRVSIDFTKTVLNYLDVIRGPFKGVDMKDSQAVDAAHKKAVALGTPLTIELVKFCRKHGIRSHGYVIGAHKRLECFVGHETGSIDFPRIQ
ncbi:MAG: DUF4838 domain-containing protein, partial [Planctomycetota bacterium]